MISKVSVTRQKMKVERKIVIARKDRKGLKDDRKRESSLFYFHIFHMISA